MGELRELEDGALLRRARGGDERAFSVLVERYSRPAYAVALSVTGTHADAEDAAQEAFVIALERLDDCRDPDRWGGWFLTIVRNRSRNLIRRESLRDGEPIPENTRSGSGDPERAAENAQLRAILRRALRELTQVQREVVLLHDLEGWKHREIAERLEMPRGTVRSHLHYARKALRGVLESVLHDDDRTDAPDARPAAGFRKGPEDGPAFEQPREATS